MPKFLMGSIVLLLLLGAGYGLTTIQARSIPWDCADWQAFAHDDRPTAILESLAENRGKTLYCGVDQSDTFTKAETWEAGRDRNERDDTVYFGERGQFRGFIAAQEGWLTDGESGVTGVSIDRIFEFPREERRYKRVKRISIASEGFCPDPHPDEDGLANAEETNPQPGTLACTDWGPFPGSQNAVNSDGIRNGKAAQINSMDGGNRDMGDTTWNILWTFPSVDYWQDKAETAAKNACRARGGQSVSNVVFGQGHRRHVTGGHDVRRGIDDAGLGWFLRENDNVYAWRYSARQSRTWTATCKKVIRRTRK